MAGLPEDSQGFEPAELASLCMLSMRNPAC